MSRTCFYAVGFTALAILDTATQVSFKFASLQAGPVEFASHWIGAAARSSWTYVAIAGYLAAFVIWMTLLEHAPVGPAFAVSHIDVVTVLLVSVPLFGERLTATEIAGAACIVAGILCLSRSEERKARGVGDSPGGAPPATTPETAPRSPAVRRAH